MKILPIGYILLGFGGAVGILVQAPWVFDPSNIALLVVTSLIVLLSIGLGVLGVVLLVCGRKGMRLKEGESKKGWSILLLPPLLFVAVGWVLLELTLAGILVRFYALVGALLAGMGLGMFIGQATMHRLLMRWVREKIKEVEALGGKR